MLRDIKSMLRDLRLFPGQVATFCNDTEEDDALIAVGGRRTPDTWWCSQPLPVVMARMARCARLSLLLSLITGQYSTP